MDEIFAVPCVGALIHRIVNGEPCVLLQERRKPGIGVEDGLLELPAGKLRAYESVFDALRREVQEETGLILTHIFGESGTHRRGVLGYDVQTFMPYCVTQNLSAGYSIVLSTFLCEADGDPAAQAGETAAPRWMPLAMIALKLEQEPEAFYPLHVNALLKYLEEHQQTYQHPVGRTVSAVRPPDL